MAPSGVVAPALEHDGYAAPNDSVNEPKAAAENNGDDAVIETEGDPDIGQLLQSSGMDASNRDFDVNTSWCTF